MRKNWNNKGKISLCLFFLTLSSFLLALCLILPENANSGSYLDSAHGNTSYGVDRSSLASFSYSKGNCAHCHEQHAMIGGAEPTPPAETGPSEYLLFSTLFADQGDGFCFQCHRGASSIQDSMPDQYNYSRIAGGDTNTCPDGIKEAFAFVDETGNQQLNCGSSNGSSHFLEDIQDFLTSKWNFSSDSGDNNPCSGCHNPHRAKRDPHTNTSDRTSAGELIVSSVSRPSQHSKDNNAWELWGDESGERMNNYTGNYQAPYRISATNYEPDGSATTNGSNLVDYVTFCTDCHNNSNTISSTPLGGNLRTINWSTEKHGQGNADGQMCVDPPYNATSSCTATGLGKVLACTDCHEPHGAPSVMLLRNKINGGVLSGTVSSGTKDYGYACRQCHMDDLEYDSTEGIANQWEAVHHCANDYPYTQQGCGNPATNCHAAPSGGKNVCASGPSGPATPAPIDCSNCHYHGSSVTDADQAPTTRTTF